MFTLQPTSFKSTQQALNNIHAITTSVQNTGYPLHGCGRDITSNVELASLFDTVFRVKWCEDCVECYLPEADYDVFIAYMNRLCNLISEIEKTGTRSHDELVASKMIFFAIAAATGSLEENSEFEDYFTYFEERVMFDRSVNSNSQEFNRSDVSLSIDNNLFAQLENIELTTVSEITADTELEILYKNRCTFKGTFAELEDMCENYQTHISVTDLYNLILMIKSSVTA